MIHSHSIEVKERVSYFGGTPLSFKIQRGYKIQEQKEEGRKESTRGVMKGAGPITSKGREEGEGSVQQ